MSPTTIQLKTYMCPNGIGRLGQPNACRFHCAIDNLPKDGKCPIHGLLLEKTTLPEDKIIVNIIDEEEVDNMVEFNGCPVTAEEGERLNKERIDRGMSSLIVKPLSNAKKNELKQKIRDDIAKFRAIED